MALFCSLFTQSCLASYRGPPIPLWCENNLDGDISSIITPLCDCHARLIVVTSFLCILLNDSRSPMLTEGFPLRSSRVGYVRVSRTRPTRRHTTLPISLLGILNHMSGVMCLLRGSHPGTITMMDPPPRGTTSVITLMAPPAKAPWLPRPRFLLRIPVATKQVLGRGSL